MSGAWSRFVAAVVLVIAAVGMVAGTANAVPKPHGHGRYDLGILGFNYGDPFRLKGAEAESILSRSR